MEENLVPDQSSGIWRVLTRRVALVSVIVVVVVLALAFVGFWATLQSARSRLSSATMQISGIFDAYFATVFSDLRATSDALAVSDHSPELFQRAWTRSDGQFFELLWIGPEGEILQAQPYTSSGAEDVLLEQPWLGTVREGAIYVGPVVYESSATPVVDIAVPVMDAQGDFASVLLARVDLTPLWDAVHIVPAGESTYVYVMDETAKIWFHYDRERLGDVNPLTILNKASDQALRIYRGDRGESVLGKGALLDVLPWYVVVEQPIAEALAPFVYQLIFLLSVVVGFSIIIISTPRFIQENVFTPLSLLKKGVQKLTEGNLQHRIEVEAEGDFAVLADSLNNLTAKLHERIMKLEQHVDERTRGLLAAAEVSRSTISMLEPDVLLQHTVMLVQDRFSLYYVGLFLLDEAGEYAVLHAGTGEAGEHMVANRHRLRVGGQTMIGQCVETGRARIALDVGDEAARFENPLLPDTRSEMALPLRAQRQVIGAMTVQSDQEAAFDEASILVMQTIADQVAVAIDNARLYARTQAALQEMEQLQKRYLGEAWVEFLRQKSVVGYERTPSGVTTLGRTQGIEVRQAIEERDTVIVNQPLPEGDAVEAKVVVPIVFRDQPLGVLGFRAPEGKWSGEQVALVEAVAEQFGQAAENLRLVDAAQRLAAREQLTRELTDEMRRSIDMETILQAAVTNLGQVLGAPRTYVRLTLGDEVSLDENREPDTSSELSDFADAQLGEAQSES